MIYTNNFQNSASVNLPPLFDNIPIELKDQNRWVVWRGKKIPRDAKALNSAASSTDPSTWASFEQARTAYEEGGYFGIGFVVSGDGIVGIDLDQCVIDGKPTEQALALMQSIGCQYIELSPSGTGLRGFGYVDHPPRQGRNQALNGLRVELYSTGRYLTVTGHLVQAGPLAQLHGYCDLHQRLGEPKFTEETEVIEVTEAIDFYSSVAFPYQSQYGAFPPDTIPADVGQRNFCIFKLARHLKLNHTSADVESMLDVVAHWYQQVQPAIRTKEFMESWMGFKTAWRNVKYMNGIMESIVAKLDKDPPNNPGSVFGLQGARLYQLCSDLQSHHGGKPFFLSCRQAGKALQITHTFANDLLSEFCHMGLITRTSKGTKQKASRYLMNDPPSS
jgi:hypothetical protein